MGVGLEKPCCYSRKCWPCATESPLETILILPPFLIQTGRLWQNAQKCLFWRTNLCCLVHWCISWPTMWWQLLHRRWQWHQTHLKFLSAAVVCLSPPTPASPNTFGTHPLVFTKLLSFVRRVPQREPIENYIFFQNFQLVKCHQHLHQLEKSNRLSINSFGTSSCPSTKFARNLCLSAPSSPEGAQSAPFSFYC